MARSRKMSSALGTCRAHFLFSQEIARAADVKEKLRRRLKWEQPHVPLAGAAGFSVAQIQQRIA